MKKKFLLPVILIVLVSILIITLFLLSIFEQNKKTTKNEPSLAPISYVDAFEESF